MPRTRTLALVLIGAAAIWGCDSMNEDALGLDAGSDVAVFKKGGNGPGGSGLPAATVTVVTDSDTYPTNAINCPTAERVGTGYSVKCDPKAGAVEPDSPGELDCDGQHLEVGLIEVLSKRGKLAEVIIHGQIGEDHYHTGRVPISEPIDDPGAVNFILYVNTDAAIMAKAKGKGGVECEVSLGTMEYDF